MTSARQKIKELIKGRLESVGVTAYTDRYFKASKGEFAMVYFGEWTTEPDTFEAISDITTGEVQIEIFSKIGDTRLEELAEKVRPVLDYDSNLGGYADYFRVVGGEYTPQIPGELPSLVISYKARFNAEKLAVISAKDIYDEGVNYKSPAS